MARAEAKAGADYTIEVEGLTKSFSGKVVVRDLSLRVRRGEIYGFLGPNGSGKTTTLRMLCGLLRPDRGRGTALGFDITRQNAAIKRLVGYMTQRFSLYEDLSIRENLDFVARVYGVEKPAEAVRQALEQLGLAERQDQLAGQLSGGWKQRLALSACVLPKPQLLLLDEPTAGVDPKARREFWGEIHALAASGMTVLVSTHYMDEAERCHEIAYIANGRILARGTIEEVVQQAGLNTYTLTGPDLSHLAEELESEPGIETVAAFGSGLHVAGKDAAALEETISRYRSRSGVTITKAQASLEDVFISLMSGAGNNDS